MPLRRQQNHPKRVLMVTVDFPPMSGGMSEHALGIVAGLTEQGGEVYVLAPNVPGMDRDVPDLQGKRVYRYPLRDSLIGNIVVITLFAVYILVRHGIRIVVNNTWSPCGIVSFLLSHLLRVRYFVFAHGLDVLEPQRSKFFKRWMIRVFQRADGILPVSRFTAEAIRGLGISGERITVVPNGIHPEKWAADTDPSRLAAQLGIRNKTVLLTVSRLVKRKGHDTVIGAVKKLSPEFPELVYLIVGEGPERSRLETLVKDLRIEDRVIFAGFVEEQSLPAYYSLCDLFVLTPVEIEEDGDVEGFGIVYLEANAMGKAVIGSRSGGIQDAVVHEETGLLVTPDDIESLSGAIRFLLKENTFRRQLGRQGRERVYSEYTWSRIASRLNRIIAA
ncbi:MAG: glycosyltransferase family 4 protein [Deltaproteobacteria bacterium]|nr:glycosyltransferase family 4 protein [Deltaproteobacteria bacterium]